MRKDQADAKACRLVYGAGGHPGTVLREIHTDTWRHPGGHGDRLEWSGVGVGGSESRGVARASDVAQCASPDARPSSSGGRNPPVPDRTCHSV